VRRIEGAEEESNNDMHVGGLEGRAGYNGGGSL
jgi:hypothetical protein